MKQGTEEWSHARCGKVTASRIADMLATTKTGWGASRTNYHAELVAERLTGVPAERYVNGPMLYGTELEPEARAVYAFERNVDVVEVGFIPHPLIADAGASPDGLVDNDGLVELKCPNTGTHLKTLLNPEVIDRTYRYQMQFQMACTGRQWCDFVSYDKRLTVPYRMSITRVPRDDKMIAEIERGIVVFLGEVADTISALQKRYG
jgi:putative phage-type endonuclease